MSNPSNEDVQSYLGRQQQALAAAQRFDEMPRTEVDPVNAVRAGLDNADADLTRTAASIEDGYLAAIDTVKEVRSQIASGSLDVDEAKKQLSRVRQQLSALNRSASRTTAQSKQIDARKADPAKYAESLIDKYPALRGRG